MLVLERMGLTPADLLAAPGARPAAPTFAEYIPVVSALVSDGYRRAYGSYWNRVTAGRGLDREAHPGGGHWPEPGCAETRTSSQGTARRPASHHGSGDPILAVTTAAGPCPKSGARSAMAITNGSERGTETRPGGGQGSDDQARSEQTGSHRGMAWLRHRAIPVRMRILRLRAELIRARAVAAGGSCSGSGSWPSAPHRKAC